MTERIVLACSGGLDTPVAIGGISAETDAEVVAVAADVGQGGEDLEVVRRRALDRGWFVDAGQQHVTGDVRVVLRDGTATVRGRRSPVFLYDFSPATYDEGDTDAQSLAKGFVELWGLPSRIAAERDQTAGCSGS